MRKYVLTLVVALFIVMMLTISCGGSAQPTMTTTTTPMTSTTTQTSTNTNTITLTTVSPTTVTPTMATITSTVIDPSLFEPTGIYIFPNNATITAGVSITFIIVAYNDEGRNMEVTDQAIFFIVMDAGGNWDNNTYTSENIGTWTVIGEYLNQISGTESWIVHATLIVEESHN